MVRVNIGSKYNATLLGVLSGTIEGRWLSSEEIPQRNYSCYRCIYPVDRSYLMLFESPTENGFTHYPFHDVSTKSPLQ